VTFCLLLFLPPQPHFWFVTLHMVFINFLFVMHLLCFFQGVRHDRRRDTNCFKIRIHKLLWGCLKYDQSCKTKAITNRFMIAFDSVLMQGPFNIKMADHIKKLVWIVENYDAPAVIIYTLRLRWLYMQNKLTAVKWKENKTGNEEQEGAWHTKHNTRAHQRDTCNNSRIAAVSPTRF
jgi:hypothetical protein